jgi:hypothetical protein
MEHPNIQKYAEAMKEIKLRVSVISSYSSGERNAKYNAVTVETIGLQFRKVFELIAFSSLHQIGTSTQGRTATLPNIGRQRNC